MRGLRLLPWVGGAAFGIAAEASLYGFGEPGRWIPDLAAGWSLIACGLVACRRHPSSRSGVLMTATGFAWFAGNFSGSELGWVACLSAHALYLYRGPLVHLVLTYPRGRATTVLDRGAIAVGYAAALLVPVWRDLEATIALSGCLVAASTLSYVRSASFERRERLAAWQATTFVAVVLGGSAVARLLDPGAGSRQPTLLLQEVALCVLAGSLLAALEAQPWRREGVADLVVELGETRSGVPQQALARALGDPTLVVGYWSPGPTPMSTTQDGQSSSHAPTPTGR